MNTTKKLRLELLTKFPEFFLNHSPVIEESNGVTYLYNCAGINFEIILPIIQKHYPVSTIAKIGGEISIYGDL